MSGGKKKVKKRTYTEGELRHIIHQARDESITQVLFLAITAAVDQFHMDGDEAVEFMERIHRYNKAIEDGLVDYQTAVNSIKNSTGIDLRLSRW